MRATASALISAAIIVAATPALARDAIAVQSAPVTAFEAQQPDRETFGPLRFIGGLQLDSADPRFGGLSGIEISPDGRRIVMVSDVGDLFAATLDYDGAVLTGLSDVTVERLPDETGTPLGTKFGGDAESLRAAAGGGLPDDLLIGFERDNRVLRYSLSGDGAIASASPVDMPAGISRLPFNQGLEGIAVVPDGAPGAGSVIAFGEGELDSRPGVLPGWVIAPDGETREIALRREGPFNLTDAVALPDGSLLVLERRFNMLTGVGMQVRRISPTELAGSDPIAGEILFAAGMAYAVDNMEGLAVHRDTAGRTILTIVSDDNFNALQRTLILQFELLAD